MIVKIWLLVHERNWSDLTLLSINICSVQWISVCLSVNTFYFHKLDDSLHIRTISNKVRAEKWHIVLWRRWCWKRTIATLLDNKTCFYLFNASEKRSFLILLFLWFWLSRAGGSQKNWRVVLNSILNDFSRKCDRLWYSRWHALEQEKRIFSKSTNCYRDNIRH